MSEQSTPVAVPFVPDPAALLASSGASVIGAVDEPSGPVAEALVEAVVGEVIAPDGHQQVFERVAPLAEEPVSPRAIVEAHREALEGSAAVLDEQIARGHLPSSARRAAAEYAASDHEEQLRSVDEVMGELLADLLATWAQRGPQGPMEEALRDELDEVDRRAAASGLAPSLHGALRRLAVARAVAESDRVHAEAEARRRRDSRRSLFPESAELEDENEELREDVAALVAENEALLHAVGKR